MSETNYFGQPHYEVVGRYGVHETIIARTFDAGAAREYKRDYTQDYPQVIIRKREF